MRGAVALGLRLTGAGAGPARLRSALVALAAAIGTTVLLAVCALARAELLVDRARYDNEPGFLWLALAVVLSIVLPVLVLAATVGRLSAELRDRRLANLRLLGLSPGQTRLVAVTETGVAALAGAGIGWALFQLLRPLLDRVEVWGHVLPPPFIEPTLPAYAAVLVGVPAAVAAVASLPQRLDMQRVLARAQRADARRPSTWRVVPLVLGAAACTFFVLRGNELDSDALLGANLVGGIALLGVGMLLVIPVAVRLMGDVMLRFSRGATTTIAARRLQAQPAGVTRVVAGLLLGLFVVVGGRCIIVAFESTPQYLAQERGLEVQQRVLLPATAATVDDVVRRARAVDGVQQGFAVGRLRSAGDCRIATSPCFEALVITCADLATLVPSVKGCRDDVPVNLRAALTGTPLPATIDWLPSEGGTALTLPAPTALAQGAHWDELAPLYGDVLISPKIPGVAELAFGSDSQVLVTAAPGRDLPDRLDAAGFFAMTGAWSDDYDLVTSLRSLVWGVAAIVLSLGLLAFAISAVDRALSRRREVVSLQLVGVSPSLLRRSQWLEAVVPVSVGSLLAVGLGLAAGATYLSVDESSHGLPWGQAGVLAVVACAGSVIVAGLTVVASSPRIRPELIRAE